MSIFNLRDQAAWNATDPNGENYHPMIQGTVVEINEVQARNFQTKQPEFWDDGNPKLNLQLIIQAQDGREYPWTFSPKSLAMDALKAALTGYNSKASSVVEIGGLMVQVWTDESKAPYGANNPRPWGCQILGQGSAPFRGANEFKPQQQLMQQQVPPPVVNGYYAPPQTQGYQQQVPPTPINRPVQPQAPMAPPQFQPVQEPQGNRVIQPPAYEQPPIDTYNQAW